MGLEAIYKNFITNASWFNNSAPWLNNSSTSWFNSSPVLFNINTQGFQNLNVTTTSNDLNLDNGFDTFSLSSHSNNNKPDVSLSSMNDPLSSYDAGRGNFLVKTALSNTDGKFTGYCAKYVKNAIVDAGLGSYTYGHAYQLADALRKNPNFKEISPSAVDVNKLPAGCVLVYDQGASGYSSEYGHTEITVGDGRAVSDGITRNLRKPSTVFIPVNVA